MKDIFVDTSCASHFANPVDEAYKSFINWLFDEGALVISKKLLTEYTACCGASTVPTNLVALVAHLQKVGRINVISTSQLTSFKIPAAFEKRMLSNYKDHVHVKTVVLSCRKFAISEDANFRKDVNSFPKARAQAGKRPGDIPYSE